MHIHTNVPLWCSPVLLEQTDEGSPCVLTVSCSSGSSAAISRLLVISEARTMELYNQLGEYCGTVRGDRDESVQQDKYVEYSRDTRREYNKHV